MIGKKGVACVIALLFVSGCATTRHYVNGTTIQGTRKVEANNDYFLSGLGQSKEVHASLTCGGANRVVATETRLSPVNNVLNFLTFGIYTPQSHTIYCR